MRRNTAAFCAACIILMYFAPAAQSADVEETKPEKLSHKDLTALLDRPLQKVYYGGLMIASGDTLEGPVIVIAGALDIQNDGVLDGDAWVVNGRLILNGTAYVNGQVDLVNSGEHLSYRARVTGGIYHYSCECRLNSERFEQHGEVVFEKFEDPRAIKTKITVLPGEPTRVDYNVARIGLVRRNPRHRKSHIRGQALLHLPVWKETGGFLGFDIDLAIPLKGNGIDLLVRGFKKTSTNDDWQVSRLENGLMTSLTGDDFADYYERRGGELGLRIRSGEQLAFEAVLSYQRDVSLQAASLHSLFHPRRKHRCNPEIDEGERVALSCALTFDTRGDTGWRRNAWMLGLWIEKGLADGPGDFSYAAFCADVKRYSRLPLGLQWDIRGRIFSSFDPIPRQITRSLNGYGGLRGLDDGPFDVSRGDRLALFSGELRAGLPELPVIRTLFSSWNLVFFTDIGLLARAENERSPLGFLDTPFGDWKKTAGIGISGESLVPFIGIYVARELGGERSGPRVIVRAMRSF